MDRDTIIAICRVACISQSRIDQLFGEGVEISANVQQEFVRAINPTLVGNALAMHEIDMKAVTAEDEQADDGE